MTLIKGYTAALQRECEQQNSQLTDLRRALETALDLARGIDAPGASELRDFLRDSLGE